MAPRTILYTGKGGVGKTSVAACTARAAARQGLRTLVISTDPAHSLSESLQTELSAEPQPVGDLRWWEPAGDSREPRPAGDSQPTGDSRGEKAAGQPQPAGDLLWAEEVSAQGELERHWSGVQEWLGELFRERGIDRISAEELTVPPGMDELFSLLRLKTAYESGDWDAIVVDCAPTGETLRLLSFPDVAQWWIEKVFPIEHQLLAAAAPLARSLLDISLPSHAVFADVRRLSENLIGMNEILRDRSRVTIRLVMNPEKMVIGEAMRTFTYLNLYGYLTDAVIVNRVFPAEVGDYFAGWRRLQQEHLELVGSAFAPVPVLRAPYFDQEVVGGEMLDRLAAALFEPGGHDPAAVLHDALTQELEVSEHEARLRLALPLADKGDVSLKKIGLELVVGVDGQRRTISLPSPLAGFHPAGARFEDGTLEVTFDSPKRADPTSDSKRAEPASDR